MSAYAIPYLVILLVTMMPQTPSPYAGQEQRAIKSLSEGEVEGYLAGKGMGFARAAELNHYPGPRHVLDLSEELELTAEQVAASQKLYDEMHAEAVELGAKLVEQERELEAMFSDKLATEEMLDDIMTKISETQGKLRGCHLRAHIRQRHLMSEEQVMAYNRLRGYASGGEHEHHGHSH